MFEKTLLFTKVGEGVGDKHNKGYFTTPEALAEAYPVGEAGDFAVVESTDTVWVWDSDNSEWVDSDKKGQVTSVNGQTGDVVIPDELPSQTGNSGKFLTTDGTDASWGDALALSGGTMTGDIKFNYSTSTTSSSKGVFFYNTSTGEQVKITVKYNNSISYLKLAWWEMSGWGDGYSLYVPESTTSSTYGKIGTETHPVLRANVKYIKGVNGSDIEVPTTGGTMAVIGVNTTITLASANWSSNSQTVNVTGMTATGIVMVSPDPTDQSAYTSAGIICSAQGAGTLTFTCDTTPSADIDVVVVML